MLRHSIDYLLISKFANLLCEQNCGCDVFVQKFERKVLLHLLVFGKMTVAINTIVKKILQHYFCLNLSQ